MNRGQFSISIYEFLNRLACAQHADFDLFENVIKNLDLYIQNLEESYDPIDEYSLKDLCEVYSYNHYNKQYLLNGDDLVSKFGVITDKIEKHKEFLVCNDLAPNYVLNWSIQDKV